jgi:hypothetical protein
LRRRFLRICGCDHGDAAKQLTKRYTQSAEAYQLYMMGRFTGAV